MTQGGVGGPGLGTGSGITGCSNSLHQQYTPGMMGLSPDSGLKGHSQNGNSSVPVIWGQSHDLEPQGQMQNSSSATLMMRNQSQSLGARGGAQRNSSPVLVMTDQIHYLGPENGTQSSGSSVPINGEVLQHPDPREQAHCSYWAPGSRITTVKTLAPGRRCSSKDPGKFCQLDLTLVKTVEVLGSKGCKCPR